MNRPDSVVSLEAFINRPSRGKTLTNMTQHQLWHNLQIVPSKAKGLFRLLWWILTTPPDVRKRHLDFLVIGAQKAGTTALDAYLREHPELCLPEERKELHFFDTERAMRRPRWYRELAYHRNFMCFSVEQTRGEVTPCYMFKEDYIRRIWDYNPEIKLLISLRDPVSRAYSQWNMQRQRGWEKRSFFTAVKEDGVRENIDKRFAYIQRGLYGRQLRIIYKYFSRDSIFVFTQEDLLRNRKTTLNHIAAFLSIAPFPEIPLRKVHQRSYDTPLSKADREAVMPYFYEDIEELESLLNWDLTNWK